MQTLLFFFDYHSCPFAMIRTFILVKKEEILFSCNVEYNGLIWEVRKKITDYHFIPGIVLILVFISAAGSKIRLIIVIFFCKYSWQNWKYITRLVAQRKSFRCRQRCQIHHPLCCKNGKGTDARSWIWTFRATIPLYSVQFDVPKPQTELSDTAVS